MNEPQPHGEKKEQKSASAFSAACFPFIAAGVRNSTRGLERASEPDSEVVNLTFLGRGSVSKAIKKATTATRRDDCLSRAAALFACGRIAS